MKTQPFYIDAPEFDSNLPPVVQLHTLCDRLNRLGFAAYIQSSCARLDGTLWTPQLTPQLQAAHYLAGKAPITVSLKPGTASTVGIRAKYLPETLLDDKNEKSSGQIALGDGQTSDAIDLDLCVPWVDRQAFRPATGQRNLRLVFAEQLHLQHAKVRAEHRHLQDISPSAGGPLEPRTRAALLQQAQCLYAYETGSIVTEARLCGCPVIYIPNDHALKTAPEGMWNALATRWNTELDSTEGDAIETELLAFQQTYQSLCERSAETIKLFANQAQALANNWNTQNSVEGPKGWPPELLDSLDKWITKKEDRAQRADRSKYLRLQSQYQKWKKLSSLREVDGQIYAEHVASGNLTAIGVVIYAEGHTMEDVAQTLDSLGQGFLQPAYLTVVAPFSSPVPADELGSNFLWVEQADGDVPQGWLKPEGMPPWSLLIEAGTTLEPQALVEFSLATQAPGVQLVYCDDDAPSPDGAVPHFKPDLNTEWLRCFNYLGSAIGVETALWSSYAGNSRLINAYGLALRLSSKAGSQSIGHIDTVLVHQPAESTYIPQQREADEIRQLQAYLGELGQKANIEPGKTWGNWLLEYLPSRRPTVSMVVPTGIQLGYLTCLLESLRQFSAPELAEIILVTDPSRRGEVEQIAARTDVGIPLRVVEYTSHTSGYNHAAALNAGAKEATGELILFMDDDTECLQDHWLQTLCAYFEQPDIACVAPRLVLQHQKDATLQGGPLWVGADGLFRSYLGERQLLDEKGMFSRLQTSQDVPAVAGHCFVTRKKLWEALEGFDEHTFSLFNTVADYCLRARQQGGRNVWTPVSNVLHHGGKTLGFIQQDANTVLELRERAVLEKEQWTARWVQHLAKDGSYNRHLSLHKPYEIEVELVIDWPRARHERPTVLGLPISSGSGQYRVIEPLQALQYAGLARTAVVMPRPDRSYRVLTPLEIARTQADTLIVQHSIGDHHFSQLRQYRQACPDLFIVQMVDDLFRDLPAKHHLHQVHRREGEMRMRKALSLCDRLVVSTQPLADAYGKYCPDVRVMPNCLDENAWDGLRKKTDQATRQRLRVGWAGAMQHLDDLEMIADVVRELAGEVDWIFMGMCPDVLRPYVKEFHPFVPYADYPAKLATLDLDIAIAPLQDNLFNESKSNLRLLEYGAMGWPVVCSDVYPFRTGNPPVWRLPNKAEAWLDALRAMIAAPERRSRMGEELHQWVRKNHYLSLHAENWISALHPTSTKA